jgi:hypothetical protein
MRTVLFLDLDDTIFQTRPKCPVGELVRPVAFRRDGTPLSFMTDRQRALLDLFARAATVIPTTARNLDAFRRVDLAFGHAAILDFGGVVLTPAGELDAEWDTIIRPQAMALAAEWQAIHTAVERFVAERHLGANARVISDFDMPLYLVVKHPDGDTAKLGPIREELQATSDTERFFIHHNDNNLSLVPRFLGKEKAIPHVLARHVGPGPVLTLGMGDSLTDLPFLELCDFSLTPRGSQLARQRLRPPQES